MWLRTFCGYEFVSDSPAEVGSTVVVPPPLVPENLSTPQPPKEVVLFLGQMYGVQKDSWRTDMLGEYKAPEGLKRIPDFLLQADIQTVKLFISKVYAAFTSFYLHPSGTTSPVAEIRKMAKHEGFCKDLQFLWWRLNVKTVVMNSPSHPYPFLRSSGKDSYFKIRPFLLQSKNPDIISRLKAMDKHVIPLKGKPAEYIMDRVVEISDGPFND